MSAARAGARLIGNIPPADVAEPPSYEGLARVLIWALALVLAALMLMVAGGLTAIAIISPPEAEHVALALIQNRAVSRGMAILMIVPVITLLALTGRVSGEAAIAALSAIAGYTLATATAGPQ